jgi:hypothetical protein
VFNFVLWLWLFGMGGVAVFLPLSSSMALLGSFDDGGMESFCSVDGALMTVRDINY